MSKQKVAGFTGTRLGMTPDQVVSVSKLLTEFEAVHHGDCQGADANVHTIAKSQDNGYLTQPGNRSILSI